MRIGINLLYLIPGEVGGTEVYGRALLKALGDAPRGHSFITYINRESRNAGFNDTSAVRVVRCPVPARFRFLRYFWEQAVLPLQLLADRVDIVHSLGYVSPLLAPCPRVTTVHDIVFLERSRDLPWIKRRVLRWFCLASVRMSQAIVVPSHATEEQLARVVPAASSRLQVIYEAADDQLATFDPGRWESVSLRLNIEWPYLLVAGIGCAHKNILRVLKAFVQVEGSVSHHLVLTGLPPADVLDCVAALKPETRMRIHFAGYLQREDFCAVLAHASALLHASLYEGFGIPVLEAQHMGVPVACSNIFSLPEIAGDGAILFDPTSVPEIAKAIRLVLTESELDCRLRERGRQNARKFSWRASGTQLIDLYQRLVSAPTSRERTVLSSDEVA